METLKPAYNSQDFVGLEKPTPERWRTDEVMNPMLNQTDFMP